MDILPIAFVAIALDGARPGAPAGNGGSRRVDSLVTLFGRTPRSAMFIALETTPGSGLIRLVVADPAGTTVQQRNSASLLSSRRPWPGNGAAIAARPGGVELNGIDQTFLRFARPARSGWRDGKTPLRLQLSGASAAIRALRDCEEETLRQWGVDIAARSALSRLPKPAGAGAIEWFRWQDYPDEAVRARASGTVVARVAVDPAGSVSNCTVVVGRPSRARQAHMRKSRQARSLQAGFGLRRQSGPFGLYRPDGLADAVRNEAAPI